MLYNSLMDRRGYAEVSVNSPIARERSFSYEIPAGLPVKIGQAVWVPFGDKILQGIIIDLTEFPGVEETREIAGIIDPVPLLSREHVSLACWLSNYYLTPLFSAIALMLPPGFERQTVPCVSLAPDVQEESLSLSEEGKGVLQLLSQRGQVTQKDLEKRFGVRLIQKVLPYLVGQGAVIKSYEIEKPKIKPRMGPSL